MKFYRGMPVFYTGFLLREWQGAKNFVWFSIIRPKYKDDVGIHAHEHRHSVQSLKGLFVFHAIGMLLSKTYRAACEVDAYAEQLKHSKNVEADMIRFSYMIATRYKLNLTKEEAFNALNYRFKRTS